MTDRQFVAPKDEHARGIEGQSEAATAAMAGARRALQAALEDVRTGAGLDPKRVADLNGELSKALGRALDAEGKAADARRRHDGGGGIDLDAARGEVERRLDRLRAGCAATAVP